MRGIILLLPILIILLAVAFAPIPMTDPGDNSVSPVLIEENDTGRLYRLDLEDGPIYYYEIDTENGTIIKYVAMATMSISVTVA